MLNLESDEFARLLGKIKEKSTLTLNLIESLDFKIWEILALNSTFIDHGFLDTFHGICGQDWIKKRQMLFERSKRFWNVRCGPSIPHQIPYLTK